MTLARAVVAVGLSFLLPGAGHAFIRDWIRALLFASLFVGMVWVVVPVSSLTTATSMSEMTSIITDQTSQTDQFIISFIVLFAAIDAGFRAFGYPPTKSSTENQNACPHCGRELDDDLEFCHWCTHKIESSPVESKS